MAVKAMSEIVDYIKNYLKNDKTGSAIMLVGAWGSGKTYFLQHELVDALKEEKFETAVVSLYGKQAISEINKDLYLELRIKKALNKFKRRKKCNTSDNNLEPKKSSGKPLVNSKVGGWFKKNAAEVGRTVFTLGKTIASGVAGYFNVNVKISGEDLYRLYKSIDLSNKLIVFEDLERSGVDVFEILGYVNNLVEQDGAKVLLIANEDEIIKRLSGKSVLDDIKKSANNSETKTERDVPYTLLTKYREQKEKTIGDTIVYKPNKPVAISNILASFNNKYLDRCLNEFSLEDERGIIHEIIRIMNKLESDNLRAIIYACQKTTDLINYCDVELNLNYFKRIFLGIVAFSLRLKKDNALVWTCGSKSPAELGTDKFPLYEFCYNYIKSQMISVSQIVEHSDAFLKEEELKQKKAAYSNAFDEIYGFPTNEQAKLEAAIKEIYELLVKKDSVPLNVYGTLANYLIAVKPIVDIPEIIDKCKEQMLANISMSEVDDALISNLTYHDGVQLWDAYQIEEYNIYKQNLLRAATDRKNVRLISAVTPDDWESIIKDIDNNLDRYIGSGSVFGRLNIPSLLGYLKQTDANALNNFRGCVMAIYRPINIKEFLRSDRENLIILRDGVNEIIDNKSAEDKVCLLQFEWLRKELEQIIDKLQ